MESVSPLSAYEILSCEVGVGTQNDRRVVESALIAETGSGPDGSSLTVSH